MTLQDVKKEVDRLRAKSHNHANHITTQEARLVHIEEDMSRLEELSQRNRIDLVRGEEVMVQLAKTTDTMNKTVNTLHDTVITIYHSMGLFGKFLKFVIFPIVVFLSGEALWSFIHR